PLRVAGIHHGPEVYQLPGTCQADSPYQPLGAPEPRNEAERDLRQSHTRPLRRDHEIARQRELESPAERDAVHRRDHREPTVVYAREDRVAEGTVRVAVSGTH